jgi:RND family efflux transporter MFP subunit
MNQASPRLDDLRIDRAERPEPSSRPTRWTVALILLLVGAGTAWWFMRTCAVPVRTAIAREITGAEASPDRTLLNASGYVTARNEATVSSKITGKVVEVFIEEGRSVTAGQVLARLDDTNVNASLQLARAQFAAAGSALAETGVRLREAEQELARQKTLRERQVSSQADFDRAEAAALSWRARLTQQESERVVAERNVAIWQQHLDDTLIRAPFAGIVTSKNAQPGEMISPMSSGGFTRTGICTIVDMTSLEIEIDVNERYINRVTPGQPVEATLDAYAEWKIPCKVIAVIPTADRQKATVRVRVGFDQLDPRILPQMAVKVAFRETTGAGRPATAAATRGVAIPRAALRSADGRDVVFLVNGGRAERRAITVSGNTATDITVATGLSAGERVIIEGPAELADGTVVTERKP